MLTYINPNPLTRQNTAAKLGRALHARVRGVMCTEFMYVYKS